MTAIKHNMIYQLECSTVRKDWDDKKRHLQSGDIKAFRWVIDSLKEAGDKTGYFDIRLADEAVDDQVFWLRFAARAKMIGHATVDLYIYTDAERSHLVNDLICKHIESIPCWGVTAVTKYEGVQTIQFTTK